MKIKFYAVVIVERRKFNYEKREHNTTACACDKFDQILSIIFKGLNATLQPVLENLLNLVEEENITQIVNYSQDQQTKEYNILINGCDG